MPKISILMPVYNGEKYLKGAIESILQQTYSDFELIIFDDCSTDHSISIIKSFQDSRIVVIEAEKNQGLFSAHNNLLERAQGEFIKYVHQDDLLSLECLEKFLEIIEKRNELAFVTCTSEFIDQYGNSLGSFPWGFGEEKIWEPNTLSLLSRRLGNIIGNPPSVMFRKEFLSFRPFDEQYKNSADWKLLMDLSSKFPVYTTSQILIKYRIHNESQSYNNQQTKTTAQEDMMILNDLKCNIINHLEIASYWRQHLQIVNASFQNILNEEYESALKLLNFILENDSFIEQYEDGECKKDIVIILDKLKNNDSSVELELYLKKQLNSNLYLWLINYGIGITYEFYSFIQDYLKGSQSKTDIIVVGYEQEGFSFLKSISNLLGLNLKGILNLNQNILDGPSVKNIPIFSAIDKIGQNDCLIILYPNRLVEFNIENNLIELKSRFSDLPVFRMREWIL